MRVSKDIIREIFCFLLRGIAFGFREDFIPRIDGFVSDEGKIPSPLQ